MKTFCRSGSIRENHYYTYVKDDITIRLRELRDIGGLSEIMKIKSHELMIFTCHSAIFEKYVS